MATVRWEPKAIAVAQVDTITVANTWAAADTVTCTINGKDLVLTVGSGDTTTAGVALGIKEMWNGTSQTESTYSVSETGNNVPEFNEVAATSSGSVVTLTSAKGVPFTLSVTETTAGDGTATEATPTAATGPNHADNGDNWDGGSVPSGTDTIIFDTGDDDILYGLTTMSGVTPAKLVFEQGYTGKVGLPLENTNLYPEYRARYLQTDGATLCEIGAGDGTGSQRMNLDFLTTAATVNITNTATSENAAVPTVSIIGSNAANTLTLTKGDVGLAVVEGEVCDMAAINVGYVSNQATDSTLLLGATVDLNSTVVTQNGGTITNECADALTTLTLLAGTFDHYGGAVTTATLEGGSLNYYSTGTISTLDVGSNATADFSLDLRGRTVSACNIYENGTIKDGASTVTWSAGIDLVHTNLDGVTLDVGTHRRITPGAVS